MSSHIKLTLCFVLAISCTSLERDIYFRNEKAKVFWNSPAPRPGIEEYSRNIPINDKESMTIITEVVNKASGSYLWGIVVPIIPVFFLPDFQFQLDKNENLKIQCYVYNEQALKNHSKVLAQDRCTSLEVTLPHGAVLTPVNITSYTHGQVVFEFDQKAEKLKKFTYRVKEVQLQNGIKKEVNIEAQVVREDLTRYYIMTIAP